MFGDPEAASQDDAIFTGMQKYSPENIAYPQISRHSD